jgi:hypothetical protein
MLWLSRGELQRLLPLRLFELQVNMVEHAVYITEASKPRSPGLHVPVLSCVPPHACCFISVTDVTETHVPP